MNLKSNRTTLGGALGAFGVFLQGASLTINATSPNFPGKFLTGCIIAGFLMQGVGIFFAHLWAADEKEVAKVKEQVRENTKTLSEQ